MMAHDRIDKETNRASRSIMHVNTIRAGSMLSALKKLGVPASIYRCWPDWQF